MLPGIATKKGDTTVIFRIQSNTSRAIPMTADRKIRQLEDWTLVQFINTTSKLGFLKLDVQKFSHGLRDFRNYIHPYKQILSIFPLDKHIAKVCFQVLKVPLASDSGDR